MADVAVPSIALRPKLGTAVFLAAVSATALLAGCADMGPTDFSALVPSGESAAQAPDAPRSMADLKLAYEQAPGNAAVAVPYAAALKQMGSKKEAYSVLQAAMQASGGTDKALLSEYGRMALDMGDVGVAKEALAKADDPQNPDWRVVMARGTALAKEGHYQMALPFFEKAHGLEPKHPSVLSNLALAYTMTGQAEKGEPLLRDAIVNGSSDPRLKQNLALVLKVQGKTDEIANVMTAKALPVETPPVKTAASVVAAPVKAETAAVPAAPALKASNITTSSIGRISTGETAPLPPIFMTGSDAEDYSTDTAE